MESDMIEERLLEAIRLKDDGHLYHREGQTLEFKEQFNWSGIADYLRDFAAFSNNKGGILVFGVTDVPRDLSGLSENAISAFKKIDPEKISGYLLEYFSGHIEWDHCLIQVEGKCFSCFEIQTASVKPIIAKKDAGKNTVLKNGEIYFRYGGRTQKINYPELEEIINSRIRKNNTDWIDRVSEIGQSGPENTAVLDIPNRNLTLPNSNQVFIDSKLMDEVNLIQEGKFTEVDGEKTLKLIGTVTPVDTVEVVREVVEDKLSKYTLGAMQLAAKIRQKCPTCTTNKIWKIIAAEGLKENPKYSTYHFRKASDRERYESTRRVKINTASIYTPEAIDHIINLYNNGEAYK